MRWPWNRDPGGRSKLRWGEISRISPGSGVPPARDLPQAPPRVVCYYRCSLCRKDNSDGRGMIAGHDGFICYPCIDLVSQIKREEEQAAQPE
jgi:ClpX C4-type zinc finger